MGDSISLRRTNTFCKKKTKNQEKQKKRYYGQSVAQASEDAPQVDIKVVVHLSTKTF